MLNFIKYYKTFLRYGLGYEGDAWFANNYISAFKDKGFYIDIGCYHPLKYSQTHKLYKLGWSGINVDISQDSIDLFNTFSTDFLFKSTFYGHAWYFFLKGKFRNVQNSPRHC